MTRAKPWKILFAPQARKDSKKLKRAGLEKQAQKLIDVIRDNPWQTPPPCEKLLGDFRGKYSRRINIRHRLVYEIPKNELNGSDADKYEGIVKILSMWNHY